MSVDTRQKAQQLLTEISGNPERLAEASGYHRALIEKLNETHVAGEQDAMALLTGFGFALAQLLGNLSADAVAGALVYVAHVASHEAESFRAAGNAARYKVVRDDGAEMELPA